MSKRSRSLEIRHHPIPLPGEFPVFANPDYLQGDHAIRFLHVHPCLEFGVCHEGGGIFVVGEKVLPFAAGDVTVINHTEVHLARSSPGTTSRWSWLYLDPLKLAEAGGSDRPFLDSATLAGPDFCNVIRPAEAPHLADLLKKILAELQDEQPGQRSAVRGMVMELMVRVHRVRRGNELRSRPSADFERIAPALEQISRNYAAPLCVADLAHACAVSEPTLRRMFLGTLGRSPRQYWHDVRLRMAASLLRTTSRSVLEISQDVGFETLSSFNRLFLSHFGMPPRQWRKEEAPAPASY